MQETRTVKGSEVPIRVTNWGQFAALITVGCKPVTLLNLYDETRPFVPSEKDPNVAKAPGHLSFGFERTPFTERMIQVWNETQVDIANRAEERDRTGEAKFHRTVNIDPETFMVVAAMVLSSYANIKHIWRRIPAMLSWRKPGRPVDLGDGRMRLPGACLAPRKDTQTIAELRGKTPRRP